MTNKNLTIGLLITLVIAVLGVFTPFGQKAVKGFSSVQSGTDVTTTNFTTISSANGISVGGVFTTAAHIALTQGTTTVCAIQSPNATSTMTMGAVLFTTGTTTASTVTMAKATSAYATTTSLGSAALAANAQGTFIASSTPVGATVDGSAVFGPNQWFVVGMAGGTGTFSPVGVCSAEFQVLQ